MIEIKTKNKTHKCYKVACFLLCLFAFSCTESPQKIIEKAKKSVVTIKTPSGSGSGFIASPDGLIVTNNHVVGNNETVEIHFPDGRTTVASPIKKGLSVLDVAYLKVDGSKFDYLPMNANCNTGDEVYAIGAPLGLSESVSKGIISNCDRMIKGVKFIQTDAAVNAGNSGGPLINKKGEVVGLLTFKISAEGVEGLNFALSPVVVWDYYENKLTNLEEALKKEVAAQNPANRSTSGKPSWKYYTTDGSLIYYYDPESIVRTRDNNVKVWVKSRFFKDLNDVFGDCDELLEVDCSQRMIRILEEYMEIKTAGGKRTEYSKAPRGWRNVKPESSDEKLLNIICH